MSVPLDRITWELSGEADISDLVSRAPAGAATLGSVTGMSGASAPVSEDIDSPGRQEDYDRKGDCCLEHHQQFCPASQDGSIGRR